MGLQMSVRKMARALYGREADGTRGRHAGISEALKHACLLEMRSKCGVVRDK